MSGYEPIWFGLLIGMAVYNALNSHDFSASILFGIAGYSLFEYIAKVLN